MVEMNGKITKLFLLIGLYAIVGFFAQLLFAISVSPLSSFEGYDVVVFKHMAENILQGRIPYYDLFDHKGPALYLFYVLGLWLSDGKWGLFCLIAMNCTLVLYVWHQIALFFTNGRNAFYVVIAALIIWLGVMEEGGMTEDLSLLAISYSIYIASKKLIKNIDPSLKDYSLVALLSSIVFFIRVNNLALVIVSLLFVSFLQLKEKKYCKVLKSYVCMLFVFLVLTLLLFGFFYLRYGRLGVEQMLFGTFTFNFAYSEWKSLGFFLHIQLNHVFFLIAAIFTYLAYYNNKGHNGTIPVMLFLFVGFLFSFSTMGRRGFPHYLITVVPLFPFALALSFRDRTRLYVISAAIAFVFFETTLRSHVSYALGYRKQEYKSFYDETDRFLETINEEDKLSIWNYNANFEGVGILQRNRLLQCNRVMLDFQLDFYPPLREEELGKLEKIKPAYIITQTDKPYLEEDVDFILSNYEIVKEVALRNDDNPFGVSILRRK